MKSDIIRIQRHLGVEADGIIGPITLQAIIRALGLPALTTWPTQAQVRSGSSIFGKPGDESNLRSITPAYTLYYDSNPVRTIRVHKLIAEPVEQALKEVLAHYGTSEIQRLGLDIYGGSYNYRSTTSGSSLSMHAWGIALDFAPQTNAYSTHAPQATLSHPDCLAWWQIWEAQGATSLGRERDIDWMHLQFARLD